MSTTLPDPSSQARLIDQAKAEASRLRSEAIQHFGDEALDGFWRGANTMWLRTFELGHGVAQRSAARLRARLQRRQAARGANANTFQTGA